MVQKRLRTNMASKVTKRINENETNYCQSVAQANKITSDAILPDILPSLSTSWNNGSGSPTYRQKSRQTIYCFNSSGKHKVCRDKKNNKKKQQSFKKENITSMANANTVLNV